MMDILKLAIKYDIPPLVEYCENQLILEDSKKYPINFELLELADKLSLSQLLVRIFLNLLKPFHDFQEHCLTKFKPRKFKKMFSKNIGIRSRLGKNTLEKVDNILQKCAESTGRFTAKQVRLFNSKIINANFFSSAISANLCYSRTTIPALFWESI
jgi:hypothetical protein